MGVQQSIFTRATTGGHSGLAALIGTRCYPQRMPESPTLPLMTYRLVSTPANAYQDHDGTPDRWTYRVQLDGWAANADAADSLGDQMFAAFAGWSSGTAVGWSQVTNRFEDYEPALNRYRQVIDIIIDHAV